MDELGRGTSTHDGVAIAYATLQFVSLQACTDPFRYLITTVSAFTLFITHYPALARLTDKYPNSLASYHMGYLTDDEDRYTTFYTDNTDLLLRVVFLYQLVSGVENRSYGLNVAKLANIPSKIIER